MMRMADEGVNGTCSAATVANDKLFMLIADIIEI
jgi:hypothetical protein